MTEEKAEKKLTPAFFNLIFFLHISFLKGINYPNHLAANIS